MNIKQLLSWTAVAVFSSGFLISMYQYTNPSTIKSEGLDSLYKDLTEQQKRSPKYALAGITVADGLEATLFAAEPTLVNPTNIDVDHLGRVWVCEAYNYRPALNGNPSRPEGDRILILEDTNGDGKEDKTTVFYQGPEIASPLGIWVMGNKVIVSQSPYVWQFTDENGDGKADKKEVIFEGVGGKQHDHGMHSFVFGPDGKLYFNFGNEGGHLLDGKGKSVVGKDGNAIDFKKYQQGMVFRCDPDFTNIEVLGDNFRNNYEVAVDSYGTMWQSDNDDDGNRGVRINYVMPHGNYGYRDEITRAGWRAPRTNMEDSIPLKHWHLNDPGVVPNLLQTGAGSPTGIVVYEGDLLPKKYQNQMIHCDAGPNVVRSYPVENAGAGYTASIENIMKGTRDQWFRPSDVCVAPDGSLLVSDWYDPGVGGHQAGDQAKGRIYRVAPANYKYQAVKNDFTTAKGAVIALQSPNLSVRYLAWTALMGMGEKGGMEVQQLYADENANPRMRARALWYLSKNSILGKVAIQKAVEDSNSDLRITGLRAAHEQNDVELLNYLNKLSKDVNPQVRRECALLLYGNKNVKAPKIWAQIAQGYDGNDRWYLEALGIGASGQWDSFYSAWKNELGASPMDTKAGQDIVWRSRGKASVGLLASLASDESVPLKERLRYFRAFDFNEDAHEKSVALLKMMKGKAANQPAVNDLVLKHLDPAFVRKSPEAMVAVNKILNTNYGTQAYLDIISRYELPTENKRLAQMAISQAATELGRSAGQQLLKQGGSSIVWAILKGKDIDKAKKIMMAIKGAGSTESLDMLQSVALGADYSMALREEAIMAMGGSMAGEDLIITLLKAGKLNEAQKQVAVEAVSGAWRKSVKKGVASLTGGTKTTAQKHPPMDQLITKKGNDAKGKEIFGMYCSVCHQVGNTGMDFGPKLTEIGSKLPKQGQYAAIFAPNSGISFGYEGFEVTFTDGSSVTGIVASKTETDLILKFPGGSTQEYKMSKVKSMKELKDSMMPTGLADAMATDELVNLVEYLTSLKSK